MITIVLLLGVALVKTTVLSRQQSQFDEQRQQAAWLAESGMQRARGAAADSSDYVGETWQVPAEVLAAGSAGVVTIRVEKSDSAGDSRRVLVDVTYPAEGSRRFSVRRESRLPRNSKPESKPPAAKS